MPETRTPLALYVHLPWCARKCPYCDFNSYEAHGPVPESRYVEALVRDLDWEAARAHGRSLASVFLGGGTPSLFSAAGIARVLESVAGRFELAGDAEITLEANPGSAEAARFAGYRAAGVNRLSLGVQSLRDARLAAIGRVHDAAAARRAVAAAREAGFENLNLDLMYGLPGDDPAGALADLDAAIALAPEHLSWYQLTLEPGTAFHRRPPALPDEDVIEAIEAAGRARLAAAGYARYEVSAYARAGRRCRHNLNYWRFGDYLGVGAGAHGKPGRRAGGVLRTRRQRHPRVYLHAAGTAACVEETRVADPGRIFCEYVMNALRLVEGFTAAAFEARTGLEFEPRRAAFEAQARRGLLHVDGTGIRASERGLRFLDTLILELAHAPVGPPARARAS